MTKIVLCGAPGSGKTRLAYDLQEILEDLGEGYFHIIDHYAEEVADRTDFGIGPLASHVTDLAISIERLANEYYASNVLGRENFIVCGSLAETAINTAITCDVLHTDVAWETGQVITPLYPLLQRSSGISHTFLLPLGDDPDEYEKLISDSLPQALEALKIDWKELPKAYKHLWMAFILKTVFDIEYEEKEDLGKVDDAEDSIEGPGQMGELSGSDG